MNIKASVSHDFFRSLRTQCRVIHAIFMREIITRYGRHNIGFAWMFAEPMAFTLGVTLIWSFSKESVHGHHITIASFALTGYSTVLIWRNTISRCCECLEPNRGLLFHRNVTVFDVFAARIALELVGVTLSVLLIFVIFFYAGLVGAPYSFLGMFAAWSMLCWYAAAMAMIVGALSEYSELVDKIWHPLSYFQLPLSGAMVMTAQLPLQYQKIILIFPVPHCVEYFRASYYGPAVRTVYNMDYVFWINMTLTWLGLYLVDKVSRRPL